MGYSSDVDLLTYFDSDCGLSVKDIYENVLHALQRDAFWCEAKNSAICVTGRGASAFDVSIDVVPGKYSSDLNNEDVYLHCNRGGQKYLKSNPEKQIGKVTASLMKQVIRLIKVYRQNANFKFKSFFLELFAIDVVEPRLKESASLFERLLAFCERFQDIGEIKIYDPANANNDIMQIHSEVEFQIIRNKIKSLYECLLTNDRGIIEGCLEGRFVSPSEIVEAYKHDAEAHAKGTLRTDFLHSEFTLTCDADGHRITSGQILPKEAQLSFIASLPFVWREKAVYLIVSNAGYEADAAGEPRGEANKMQAAQNGARYRHEHTLYNGDHYVQAYFLDNGTKHYSNCIVIRVRDY